MSVLRYLGLGRILKLTGIGSGRNGIEIVEGASGDRPVLRPFSSAADADISADLNGVGTGVWRVNGSIPIPPTSFGAKGDLLAGTASGTFSARTVGANGTVLTADSAEATGVKWAAPAGGGDALTTNPLSQFAATTSAQLAGVISDETGSGALVFATSPTLVTPNLGTPSALVATNATGTAAGLTAGTVTTNANLTGPITSVGNATTIADAELAAIAGLTSAADRGIVFTGSGTASLFTLTPFALTLLDDAAASNMRTTLGLVIGTDVQAQDAELSAIAGLTSAADSVPYFTGSGTAALATVTAAARTVLDDASVSAMVDTLGGASALGSGGLVRGTSPTLTTPTIAEIRGGTPQTVAQFADAASVANYFYFQSRAAAGKPRMTFTGSDTDVTGVIATKGAGTLQYAPGGLNLRDILNVGLTGETQTIGGKIVFPSGATDAPSIPDHTNATHTHQSTAQGGSLDAAAIGSGTMATARLGSGSPSATNALLGNQTYGNPAPAAHTASHKDGGSDEVATTTPASGAIPKAGSNTKLAQAWIPEGGFHDFAHPGTSEYEAWFAANCAAHTAFSAQALVANRLYAMPFVAPGRTGCTLDRLAINVTTGSAGNARLGIYNDSSGYPGTLLLDAGTVVTTSIAVVAATISQALTPGNRYWLVYVSDATPTIRSIPVNSCTHALGFSSALGTAGNCGLYVSFTYAALPTPFPSTPTMITANPIPALFYRYSA